MPLSACIEFTEDDRGTLLHIARQAICASQATGQETAISDSLGQCRGVFVTLKKDSVLRGCIGQLESNKPLAVTVAECAAGAAYRDPRFPPLEKHEREQVIISISVLSPLQPLAVRDQGDLLHQLRPGIDGLLIAEGRQRATFLPAVWEQLPDRADFLQQLLLKAGLPEDYWSSELACSRYTSCSFTEPGPRTRGPGGLP